MLFTFVPGPTVQLDDVADSQYLQSVVEANPKNIVFSIPCPLVPEPVWKFMIEYLQTSVDSTLPFKVPTELLTDFALLADFFNISVKPVMYNLKNLNKEGMRTAYQWERLFKTAKRYKYFIPEHKLIELLDIKTQTIPGDLVWFMRCTWHERYGAHPERACIKYPCRSLQPLTYICPLFKTEYVKNGQCVVAGGALLYLMLPHRPMPSDVDVWVQNVDGLKFILNDMPPGVTYEQHGQVITAKGSSGIPLQLICSHDTPLQIIIKFDIDYVRCYHDGRNITFLPECLHAWNTRTIRYGVTNTRQARVFEARRKGFRVDPSLNALIEKSKRNKPNAERFKTTDINELSTHAWQKLDFLSYRGLSATDISRAVVDASFITYRDFRILKNAISFTLKNSTIISIPKLFLGECKLEMKHIDTEWKKLKDAFRSNFHTESCWYGGRYLRMYDTRIIDAKSRYPLPMHVLTSNTVVDLTIILYGACGRSPIVCISEIRCHKTV